MNYKDFFKNKKITVMGLGLLGRGVGDTKFLAECGADLIVTDLKSEQELAESLRVLKEYSNIKFILGEHRLEDFEGRDFILKAAGVPLDSKYIEHARHHTIPVEMSAALFAKLSGVKMVGVTGTRGKSMTTQMIFEMLKASGAHVLLGGNVRGVANLPLLKEVKKDSIAVFELDSWQLQGFGEAKISPHIAVFTNFYDDHLNYYKTRDAYFQDKAQIFLHQTENDYLIVRDELQQFLKHYKIPSELRVVNEKTLPKEWELTIPGEHVRLNAGLALEVARILGVSEEITKKAVETFEGLPGRLEFLREWNGIKIYNDNNATTAEATVAALETLGDDKNVVLIMGGADKGLSMDKLISKIKNTCKHVVLLSGTGSDRIRKYLEGIEFVDADDLQGALALTGKVATKGDIILFSPAFASFGLFKNEYERNDKFVELVKNI